MLLPVLVLDVLDLCGYQDETTARNEKTTLSIVCQLVVKAMTLLLQKTLGVITATVKSSVAELKANK
jgi:hypothetical protein